MHEGSEGRATEDAEDTKDAEKAEETETADALLRQGMMNADQAGRPNSLSCERL